MGGGSDKPEQPRAVAKDELFELIAESAADFAIFTMDPNGITTTWNSGAERLLGYDDHEIIGQPADVTFPPEEGGPSAAEEERRTALAQGRAEDERWQRRKDGTRFWASGLMMPLADRRLGFVKILRDRTPQHRAEEQVRGSEELFRTLATNIPQLVFRSKASGARTWGSPQWSAFTGLTLPDSLELGWLEAVHPDDREATLSAWIEAPAKGEYYVEHRFRRAADGEYRWHQTVPRRSRARRRNASSGWARRRTFTICAPCRIGRRCSWPSCSTGLGTYSPSSSSPDARGAPAALSTSSQTTSKADCAR